MNVAAPPLLITTALETTFGVSDNILFLGEWCKKYEHHKILEQRNHETLQFHWDDRAKLAKDYAYLENLHQSLLVSLTRALNRLHGVSYSKRYWQILLDPWLMAYIGTIFDRWECLRIAFDKVKHLDVVFIVNEDSYRPPYSYNDFVSDVAYSDEWNQHLYQRIIDNRYLNQCSVRKVTGSLGTHVSQDTLPGRSVFYFVRRFLLIPLRNFVGYLNPNTIAFVGASFNRYALFRLKFQMGQFLWGDPLDEYRPVCSDSGYPLASVDSSRRSKIVMDLQCSTDFEKFLLKSIIDDIPMCLIEHYEVLRDKVREIAFRPRVIVTGSAHWSDYFAKMWFAELISSGVQLLILEHGGSLPPFKELFNFEADISDLRASWFLPYHPKHVQMPPPKIIARGDSLHAIYQRLTTRKQFCSLIGNECARWVHRAHFYPMASQWSCPFEMSLAFYGQLDDIVKESFRIKPYPTDLGWSSHRRFVDLLGSDKVYKERSLKKVFLLSRVIVCSYPETTFSEAMASGVPTILVYPSHLYELNSIALPLLEVLKSAKIVFHNPTDAAHHLNCIWGDPCQWWNAPTTVLAREEFSRQALNLTPNWIVKWVDLLKTLSLEAAT
jgi:putative transferase (TIGR04331 family)